MKRRHVRRVRTLGLLLSMLMLTSLAWAQTVPCDGVPAWSSTTVYFPGDRVVFESRLYESQAVIHSVTPEEWLVGGWGILLGTCGGEPQPLEVTITSPEDGASFSLGTPIPIAATVTGGTGAAQVEFRLNGNTLGTDTSAPFTFGLNNAPSGSHLIEAVATTGSELAMHSIVISVTPDDPPGDAVAIIGSWQTGASHAPSAGENRALLLTVHVEHDSAIAVNNATYGGQPMDKVVEFSEGTDFRAVTAVFVLGESGIAQASGSQFVAGFSDTPFRPAGFSSVFLEGVDQGSPIGGSAGNGVSGPDTVTTASLPTQAGDLVVVAATSGNTGTYTVDNGFLPGAELAITSADGVAGSLSASGGIVTPSVTHSNANRQSIVGVVVRAGGGGPVAPILTASPVSSSQINLSWTDPSGGSSGFELQRAGSTGGFATIANLGIGVTSFSDAGLPANTLFQYRVRTSSGGQNGPFSDPVTARTLGDGPASGFLTCTFELTGQTATTFTGTMLLANSNESYAWNGVTFDIHDVTWQTTGEITSMRNINGVINFSQQGDTLSVDVGFQSIVEQGNRIEIAVEGNKSGTRPFPEDCVVNYVRGDTEFPEYQGLPASWFKGKTNLTASDLIANQASYYQDSVPPQTSLMIVRNPSHPTQIVIGEKLQLDREVNTEDNVRVYVPNSFIAMGIGFVYEYLKINPNYMCALGSKENFTCAVLPAAANVPGIPIEIDGQPFIWPIVIAHPDGPFQVETGNFLDVVQHYPDFFLETALHDDYTLVSINEHDRNWIASPILAGLSLTITRETLHGVRGGNYSDFINQANDPHAEMETITFAYNRGISNFFSHKLLTDNRQQALATGDIVSEFNLGGFASHVQTVRDVTLETNQETENVYDAPLTFQDVQDFLDEVRTFLPNGVPSNAEWAAMTSDVQRAFNVLAEHWGDGRVRYRFDFLTLLRVLKEHLPKPDNPRPTGDDWFFLVRNAVP